MFASYSASQAVDIPRRGVAPVPHARTTFVLPVLMLLRRAELMSTALGIVER